MGNQCIVCSDPIGRGIELCSKCWWKLLPSQRQAIEQALTPEARHAEYEQARLFLAAGFRNYRKNGRRGKGSEARRQAAKEAFRRIFDKTNQGGNVSNG